MTDQMTLIETLTEERKKMDAARAKIAETRKTLRALPKPSTALEEARTASSEAQAKVQRFEEEQAEAEALLATLNARLDAGDEGVSVDDIVKAEKSIERLTRLLKPAKQAAAKAERALRPLEADEHLANLAADSLEAVTDVPVVIYKTPSEAPDIEPLVVVSQTQATEDYGTLDASGQVRLTCKDIEIDLEALKEALEETGSEVNVTESAIIFNSAHWPTPRLANPSSHAVSEYMGTMQQAWASQVAGGGDIQRLVDAGYSPRSFKAAWKGLMHRGNERVQVTEAGVAVGEAVFHIAAQHERGDSLGVPDLKGEIEALTNTFRAETIGGVGDAGEIVDVELVDVTKHEGEVANPWERKEVCHHLGGPVWPITAECRLKITYRFEQVEEV